MSENSIHSWDIVPSLIAQIVESSVEPFEERTITNAHALVKACAKRCAPPEGVAKGYWPTISISWQNIEVEIFADRFELYIFRDRGSDISYFPLGPLESVPDELLQKLPIAP